MFAKRIQWFFKISTRLFTVWNRKSEQTHTYFHQSEVGWNISVLVPAAKEDEVIILFNNNKKGLVLKSPAPTESPHQILLHTGRKNPGQSSQNKTKCHKCKWTFVTSAFLDIETRSRRSRRNLERVQPHAHDGRQDWACGERNVRSWSAASSGSRHCIPPTAGQNICITNHLRSFIQRGKTKWLWTSVYIERA